MSATNPVLSKRGYARVMDVVARSLTTFGILFVVFRTSAILGLDTVARLYLKALFSEYLIISFGVLILMVIAVENINSRAGPILGFSFAYIWRKGQNTANVALENANIRFWGTLYTALLIISLPVMALWEEVIFRENLPLKLMGLDGLLPSWLSVIIWSMIAFGLAHMFSLVTLGESLILGLVGGGWFSFVYSREGLLMATVAHASYNMIALCYMLVPEFRSLINKLIQRASTELSKQEER